MQRRPVRDRGRYEGFEGSRVHRPTILGWQNICFGRSIPVLSPAPAPILPKAAHQLVSEGGPAAEGLRGRHLGRRINDMGDARGDQGLLGIEMIVERPVGEVGSLHQVADLAPGERQVDAKTRLC